MKTTELSHQKSSQGELLSALADGELVQQEVCALLQTFEQNPAASDRWNTYHAIGEVLRSPGSCVQLTDAVFVVRLNQQLAKEPSLGSGSHVPTPTPIPIPPSTVTTALRSASGIAHMPVPTMLVVGRTGEASNSSYFRWKVVAGLACAAAVFVVTWSLGGAMLPDAGSQLAQSGTLAGGTAPAQVVVVSPQGPMVRDARLEELLAAHKQLGATSAWPVPSGFLRNATFETPQSLQR